MVASFSPLSIPDIEAPGAATGAGASSASTDSSAHSFDQIYQQTRSHGDPSSLTPETGSPAEEQSDAEATKSHSNDAHGTRTGPPYADAAQMLLSSLQAITPQTAPVFAQKSTQHLQDPGAAGALNAQILWTQSNIHAGQSNTGLTTALRPTKTVPPGGSEVQASSMEVSTGAQKNGSPISIPSQPGRAASMGAGSDVSQSKIENAILASAPGRDGSSATPAGSSPVDMAGRIDAFKRLQTVGTAPETGASRAAEVMMGSGSAAQAQIVDGAQVNLQKGVSASASSDYQEAAMFAPVTVDGGQAMTVLSSDQAYFNSLSASVIAAEGQGSLPADTHVSRSQGTDAGPITKISPQGGSAPQNVTPIAQGQAAGDENRGGAQGKEQSKRFQVVTQAEAVPTAAGTPIMNHSGPLSSAVPQNAASGSPSSTIDRFQIAEQVSRHLEAMNRDGRVSGGHGELSLKLAPAHLGSLHLTISSDERGVTARIIVHSAQAHQAVEAAKDQLRTALENRGLNIHSIDVSLGQSASDGNPAFARQKDRMMEFAAPQALHSPGHDVSAAPETDPAAVTRRDNSSSLLDYQA